MSLWDRYYMQTFSKVVFGWYLHDCASPICLISPASNHTKLVHRGNNPNKKTLIYMPYVSCNFRLSGMLTCKLERCIDRLDASTLSGENPISEVAIRNCEWGIPQQRSWAFEWGKSQHWSRIRSCFWVRKIPISRAVTLVGTWNGGTTHQQIRCVYSESGKSQRQSDDLAWTR